MDGLVRDKLRGARDDAGGDEIDGTRHRVVGHGSATHQRAEVHDGDPVGDLEDVVEVVRNHEDADASRRQGLDESQDLRRLGDAERRRGFVHDDQLRVTHDGSRHGDGLTLAARK